MKRSKRVLMHYIIGNYIPFLQIIILIILIMSPLSLFIKWTAALSWIYIFPPLICRVIFFIFSKPSGRFNEDSLAFRIWYYTSQFQAIFLRFGFLEEVLRIIPLLYSHWLRLWGSHIGKNVYWSPKCFVMDRSYLHIEDFVIVGFGAGFTGHLIDNRKDSTEIIIAQSVVKKNAVIGGRSILSPGATVQENETLPATMNLAPFYTWQNGRRYAQQ